MTEPAHNSISASLHRLRLLVAYTIGAALRMKLTMLLGVAAALMVGGTRWLREFNFGPPELKLMGDFGLGAMGLLGTLLAALAPAQLFFADLADGTMACVLTRPVRRWEYITGKLAGVSALLALFTVALGALLGGLLVWRSGQLGVVPVALPSLLSACALQWMKFTVVGAMTLFICTYAGTALFASCGGLLLAVIGHLHPFARGGAWDLLRLWPNLALFDAEVLLASGLPLTASALLGLLGYWALCLLLSGVLASYAFKHREF